MKPCWHKWSKWSEPYRVTVNYRDFGKLIGIGEEMNQERICKRCGKRKTRKAG